MFEKNKPRLYVALYDNTGNGGFERRHHWALIVGPKDEETSPPYRGMHYQILYMNDIWTLQEDVLPNVQLVDGLQARIMVGKITNYDGLVSIIRTRAILQNEPSWDDQTWVADVLAAARSKKSEHGRVLGHNSVKSWREVEEFAEQYVKDKYESGRYCDASPTAPRPTYDLMERRELIA